MTRRARSAFHVRRAVALVSTGLMLGGTLWSGALQAADWPVTPQQKGTAQKVAQEGVALSDLAANAPDAYTVKPHDTLWDISKLFLKSPWRWPELWGMNLQQIRNPHWIYPGQVLTLDKSGGRARLRIGGQVGPDGTVKLEPRVRSSELGNDALASIPFNLIEPFLNEAVIFQTDELAQAPRIVATQEGRVLLARGDTAYVRGGDLSNGTEYRIFREPKPLRDPTTHEVLGYEATYVGAAEYTRQGETRVDAEGKSEIVPATFRVTSVRQEAGIGDRLAVVPPREFTNYAPHAPQGPMSGQIVSLYGDALTAGQNQIVALNRGAVDGMERGHVLALVRTGVRVVDATDPSRPVIKLPDERNGLLFVFRVFDRMSYALILTVKDPVKPGDRFTQP
ncbi:MAG: LysM peptidoglycan-binding domain-containing protein [Burkholderiales bacterium]|nr:LysM peptidoglycan-binding domain-containing protein [Burkholderiales bacterium]